MEDKRQEIAQQMRELLQQHRQAPPPEIPQPLPRTSGKPEGYGWLPACRPGEFLLQVPYEGENCIVCAREPSWREAARIEMYAFRKHDDGREYFSGEYERRELMSMAIEWVADSAAQSVHEVKSLSELSYDFGEALWAALSRELFVQFEEAKALSSSARRFFAGEIGGPVHPFILDVDGVTKGMLSFSMAEWSAMSMSDFERYQIVWREYSHHIASPPRASAPPGTSQTATNKVNAQAMNALFGARRPK